MHISSKPFAKVLLRTSNFLISNPSNLSSLEMVIQFTRCVFLPSEWLPTKKCLIIFSNPILTFPGMKYTGALCEGQSSFPGQPLLLPIGLSPFKPLLYKCHIGGSQNLQLEKDANLSIFSNAATGINPTLLQINFQLWYKLKRDLHPFSLSQLLHIRLIEKCRLQTINQRFLCLLPLYFLP